MQWKQEIARSRTEQRGAYGTRMAINRLEREHVALLTAICELEVPFRQVADDVAGSPAMQQTLMALLREELRHTQHALHLAARGRYGLCEVCRRPLSRRHLDRNPATTRCLACEARARRVASS
jgi:hypothetical protein